MDALPHLSKAERTRRFIIEQAAPVFNKKGYTDTSLQDIMQATGLTKGAIYGNFGNKDALAVEVFVYNVEQLQRVMATKAVHAVDALLDIVAAYRKAHPAILAAGGCPIMNAATEADDNYPPLKAKVQEAMRNFAGRLADIMKQGVEKGELNATTNPERMATVFLAMIEGGLLLSKTLDEPERLEAVLLQMEEMVQRDLKA